MPKPKKTKIKLDNDSFETLLQEIYNDIQVVQKKAKEDIEKRDKSITIENSHDALNIGKVNNESLKIIDSSIDKKLTLAKLQSQVINSTNKGPIEEEKSGMSDETKKLIREMIGKKTKEKNIELE